MPRCDNTTLYRVICGGLLALAVTFIIILADVFINVDKLLVPEDKDEGTSRGPVSLDLKNNEVYERNDFTHNTGNDDYRQSEDEKDDDFSSYRAKRSLDPKTFQFHLKNPKVKEILTNKLATLLEELDAEEAHTTKKTVNKKDIAITNAFKNLIEEEHRNERKQEIKRTDEDLLHLAMHNILLQGIIGHMDFNDVYKKVHDLMKNFENGETKHTARSKNVDQSKEAMTRDVISEAKFFEELIKCDDLQRQVSEATDDKPLNTRRASGIFQANKWENVKWEKKAPQMLIKTVIDIKTLKNNTFINENNIKGQIKFVYNGKPIRFTRIEEDPVRQDDVKQEKYEQDTDLRKKNSDINEMSEISSDVVTNFIDKAVINYLKKHPKLESQFKNKRLKRNVKIRVKERDPLTKPKNGTAKKQGDDELLVEIETHFDSKGVKSEKKKRIIKNIVEKIEKAIHSDKRKKKHKLKVKKRVQSPIKVKSETIIKEKVTIPFDPIERRDSNPISKMNMQNEVQSKFDKSGEALQQSYFDSKFLTSQDIASEETGVVDFDYSKVALNTGIPQRFQQPLNTDNVIDENDENSFLNVGDLKFYVKEIDGPGFSIGFNQYVGEAPDPASIKLFTGLQQLVQAYHQNYEENESNGFIANKEKQSHEVQKRDVQSESFIFDEEPIDSHRNEYKVIFDKNILPYDSYSEIIEDQDKRVKIAIQKEDKSEYHRKPFIKQKQSEIPQFVVNDDNLFKKNLKPSEIFGIASILDLDRKKRSPMIKVKKFASLNSRTGKMSRYLNTNRTPKRMLRVLSNNKRNKRDIDKIRIIATDVLPSLNKNSDENIYIVSDEIFPDKNAVREVELPEFEGAEINDNGRINHEYKPSPPKFFNEYASPPNYNEFSSRSRHNALMSKYPHLFLEELEKSKEEESPQFYNRLLNSYADYEKKHDETPGSPTIPISNPGIGPLVPEFADVLQPDANYKLTVKITPKNHTEPHSGFKEIHTSINKSINRNGLIYSTQLNVSEYSKVENANRKHDKPRFPFSNIDVNNLGTDRTNEVPSSSYYPLVKHIKEQQEKMKLLLKQHSKKIDVQLDTLNKEKQNIESIIVPNGENKKEDTIDVMLPLNPPQMLHLNRDEAGQLISSALLKLSDAPLVNDVTPTQMNSTTEAPKPAVTRRTNIEKMEPEKQKILNHIQRNENLTNLILYKIDRNTHLLQKFLQKLADKLETANRRTEANVEPKRNSDWKNVPNPILGQNLPNFEPIKNGSRMAIPFLYAYQHPYPSPSKNDNPVASVVYQGHIHTNTHPYNHNFKHNDMILGDKRENKTSFFFDGPVQEYRAQFLKNNYERLNDTKVTTHN